MKNNVQICDHTDGDPRYPSANAWHGRSAQAKDFWRKFLQSHLQTSLQPLRRHVQRFGTLGTFLQIMTKVRDSLLIFSVRKRF